MEDKMFVQDVLKMVPEKVTNDLLKKNFKNIEFDDGTYDIEAHDLKSGSVDNIRGMNSLETQVTLLSASNALCKLFKEKKLDKEIYFSVFCVNGISREHISDFIPNIVSFTSWMKSTATKRLVDSNKINNALYFLGIPATELESITKNVIKTREQTVYRIKLNGAASVKSDTSMEDECDNEIVEGAVFQV